MALSQEANYTIVTNVSGEKQNFPFLPPHGVELDVDESFQFYGDLLSHLASKRPPYAEGLVSAMNDGLLVITKSASPILDQGEGYTGESRGQELLYEMIGLGMAIPASVVGLWWPGQSLRLGDIEVGTDTCTALKNWIPGQPDAVPGTFTYTAGNAAQLPTVTMVAPSVQDAIFGDDGAILLDRGIVADVNSHGLKLFPAGYDQDLIDGTELLGISMITKLQMPSTANATGFSAATVNGNNDLKFNLQRTGAQPTDVTATARMLARNCSSAAEAYPTTPGSASSLPYPAAGGTGPLLTTMYYNGTAGKLRINKVDAASYSGFTNWTAGASVSATNAHLCALRIFAQGLNVGDDFKQWVGPFAVFKSSASAQEIADIENLLHEMVGNITLSS